MKIAIYTIAKNEAQHVERWGKSNSQADLRLVCDTGSTDSTVKDLERLGVTVVPITVDPWRFDVARATALNLLPRDIDVCIWQDLDEELLPGWREQLEQHWTKDATIANHRYRNNGRPWQWHSKIHARHNCLWTGAVHETLTWSVPEKAIWIPELYLDEHQDVTKDRRSYLALLEKKIQEGDRNWRTYYFLANDYEVAGRLDQSIETRIRSYNAVDDGPVVQSYVATNIARGFARKGDHKSARRWFQTAADHSPERETMFAWAEYCYNQQDWGACYLAARECLAMQERRDGFTYDERAWSWIVYDIAALAAHNLGIRKQAQEWGQQALSMNPRDPRLANNVKFYQETQ
jgi:tetratricopeptide (TPR) repeat protein